MVPTGTFSRISTPSRPVLFEPSPWRPRCALYSGLKRKWTSVLWRSLDSMMTPPPLPPSPAEGEASVGAGAGFASGCGFVDEHESLAFWYWSLVVGTGLVVGAGSRSSD